MSAVLFLLLSAVAGAAIVGCIRLDLGMGERLLVSAVVAATLPPTLSFLLGLVWQLHPVVVWAGPLLVLAGVGIYLAVVPRELSKRWLEAWHASWQDWRSHSSIGMLIYAVVVIAFWSVILGRALIVDPAGNLAAGYPTVWADWSQHLTLASSFAVAGNLPPQNPLFSNTPLLYPFMPDFHSAELMVLGMGASTALVLPQILLASVATILLPQLARRIGLRPVAGGIAAAVAVLGGGLGFVRVLGDACLRTTLSPSVAVQVTDVSRASSYGCSLWDVVSRPSNWPSVLGNIGGVI